MASTTARVNAGAEIVSPLTTQDYGSRDFTLRDPGGSSVGVWHLRYGRDG